MRLSELDVHKFSSGLAFLCPCCKREYLTCFFRETPYVEQKELMRSVVDTEKATWIPFPAFISAVAVNEDDLERITIRPPIDARALGHAKVTVSHGEVDY